MKTNISNQLKHPFDRHRRLWLARSSQLARLLMHRVRPGSTRTGFRCHSKLHLDAEPGGDRFRFPEGGQSRRGYAGFHAEGLRPNTTFAVFLTEMPVPPLDAVQYIGDFTTNAAGRGSVRVDAIINEAFAFNNITGIRTDLNHIVFWFADPADDEDCVPVLLPHTLMETVSPESRRCLRRIFFLARHSRNLRRRP